MKLLLIIYNFTFFSVQPTADKLAELIGCQKEINIYYMPRNIEMDGAELSAYVMPTPQGYNIFINAWTEDSKIKEILAHEFAHIEQYEKGELVILDYQRRILRYKGKIFKMTNDRNYNAPHEQAAYKRQRELLRGL